MASRGVVSWRASGPALVAHRYAQEVATTLAEHRLTDSGLHERS